MLYGAYFCLLLHTCLFYAAFGGPRFFLFFLLQLVRLRFYRSPFPVVLDFVSDNYVPLPLQLSLCCLHGDCRVAAGFYWHLRRLFVSIKFRNVAEVAGGRRSGVWCLAGQQSSGTASRAGRTPQPSTPFTSQ